MKREKVIALVMDIVYLLIGFLAMIASIKFSYKFFRYNGHPIFWSAVISIVYVLFLNLIFEAAIAIFVQIKSLKLERNKQRDQTIIKRYQSKIIKQTIQGTLIMIAWLFLVFYSVISTVGGQYDQLSDLKIDSLTSNVEDISQVDDVEQLISIQEENKRLYEEEIEAITRRLNTVEDIEKSYTYKNTSAKNEDRLDYLRTKIVEIDNVIIEYRKQIMKIKSDQNNITNGNVYRYFERVIRVPGFIIQFILSFFPSIVLDFFAPISFAMVIFRKRD